MSAEIYWRRRLLALAGIFLIAWIAVQLWPSGTKDAPNVAPSVAPTSGATSAPTPATSTPPPTPVVAATDGIRMVSLESSDRACDPQQVRVTPTVPSGQRVGSPVAVEFVVSSTETTACTLTPEKADLLVVISSDGTAVYDSTVCKTSLLAAPVSLSPLWSTVVQTEWSGRGSGPRCLPREGFAAPGSYKLQVGTLGGEPGKATFSLARAPQTATVTPPTKPTTTPTSKAKNRKAPVTTQATDSPAKKKPVH